MCPLPGLPQEAPIVTRWNSFASSATYAEAPDTADRLEAAQFPVAELEIVGSKLRSVKRVTGPMSWNRAAWSGVATGAWVGLFVGLLVGLFSPGAGWFGLMFGGVFIGAVWGAAFGVGARRYRSGHHNFSSLSGIVATKYEIIAGDDTTTRARSALGLS